MLEICAHPDLGEPHLTFLHTKEASGSAEPATSPVSARPNLAASCANAST